jgi:putative ABC transport system permease protein
MSRRPTPPLLARVLLRLTLPPSWRASTLGDLEEEWSQRSGKRQGAVSAHLWYLARSVEIAARFLLERAAVRLHRLTTPPERWSGNRKRERRVGMMDSFLQDVRYGARMLRKNRGFAAVAVLTLALGIGANTAIFSVVNAVLLRPLPFREPDRLVRLRDTVERPGEEPKIYNTSPRNYFHLKEQEGIFAGITAQEFRWFNLTGAGDPAQIRGIGVSPGWADFLGVAPIRGRPFLPEEERAGSDSRAVLVGYGLWQRRFGGAEGLLGRPLTLNGDSYTVVGLMSPLFNFPYAAELWVPHSFDPTDAEHSPMVTARLREGVTLEQAHARLNELAYRLADDDSSYQGWNFRAIPLRDDILKDHHNMVLALLGAVGMLLLIACANVASLLLARSNARQKEIAIRAALGATRFRQTRQLATEALLLAALGGGAGLLLALNITDLLAALSPPVTSLSLFFQDIRLDGRVLGFSALATLLTGFLFGLAPILRLSRPDLHSTLRDGGRSGGHLGRHRALGALVVTEVALALLLLMGASVMGQNLVHLLERDMGFARERVLTARLSLPDANYRSLRDRVNFIEQVVQRMESLPGVRAAGFSTMLPVEMATQRTESNIYSVEGQPPREAEAPVANIRGITARYFHAMGIPLLRGRAFTEDETRLRGRFALIVSQRMARRNWPGEDPLGQRIKLGPPDAPGPWWTVVGVADDVLDTGDVQETCYLPVPFNNDITLAARSEAEAGNLASLARGIIWDVDPSLPIERVHTMDEIVSDSLSRQRTATIFFSLFGVFSVGLAALGIYGVLAYSVSQRLEEIGVRMALGAQRRDILQLVVGQGFLLALLGAAIGLAASFWLTRTFSGWLFQDPVSSPLPFIGAPVFLVGVALLACYLPARRALRLDPMAVLRYE